MKFSIGMAVYDDFYGVWPSVQSLLIHHADHVGEVLVIDNNPDSMQGKTTAEYCSLTSGLVRYIPYRERQGTAAPRNEIFKQAKCEYAVCIDSHVLLLPNALKHLAFFIEHGPKNDLMQGPLIGDNCIGADTHFADVWQAGMWGVWELDARYDAGEVAFEIPAQGLGLFAARCESWLKFNELFSGYGGEEWYIHEKYRKHGRACWCVSGLRWQHRFYRPTGVPYPHKCIDIMTNYFIGLSELGLSTDRMVEHYSRIMPSASIEEAKRRAAERQAACV